MKRKNFCDLGPWAYSISLQKQIAVRHLKNCFSGIRFATERRSEPLPVVVAERCGNMIKRGPGIDLQLQLNKADNIRLACSRIHSVLIRPGETFSFWHCVGKTSRKNGFAAGRVLVNGRLVAGVGGGLCNLANTINLLVMHSPLTRTEVHHHSDALAPDPDGVRVPYSAGTSVSYNYLDYRFLNETDCCFQLLTWCEGDDLHAELRAEHDFPFTYRLAEEDHHFCQEASGDYYRCSRIYREKIEKSSGNVVSRELLWNNHSKVMFDPALIPADQVRV